MLAYILIVNNYYFYYKEVYGSVIGKKKIEFPSGKGY